MENWAVGQKVQGEKHDQFFSGLIKKITSGSEFNTVNLYLLLNPPIKFAGDNGATDLLCLLNVKPKKVGNNTHNLFMIWVPNHK